MMIVLWLGMAPPVKQEAETRIQRAQFPATALAWLEPVTDRARSVRYYRQTDGADLTYEIKFRLGAQTWSVEFLEDGTFVEAERIIRQGDLPDAVITHLDARFHRWKTSRIQAQHIPGPSATATVEWFRNPTGAVGYEVEVEGRKGAEIGRFELTFDAAGTFVEERRVIEIPIDL